MWRLDNRTPFAVERAFCRDLNGVEIWIVAVKASYRLAHNGSDLELAAEQQPVRLVPSYRNQPSSSSLLYDQDLVADKDGTDVLLEACAYAPEDKAIDRTDAILRIGKLVKHLHVWGDRYWAHGIAGLKASPAEPFLKMPITYERAYGGAEFALRHSLDGATNPVGVGFATSAQHAVGTMLPNVEYGDQPTLNHRGRGRVAGFGPIAPHWQPRAAAAGTHDEQWRQQRFPLRPLDFSPRYFRSAPLDQQLPYFLRGGETVELVNLAPERYLRFEVPRVVLSFQTFFGRKSQHHRANCHSLILEPEHRRLSLVWQTSLPCHHREHLLERTVIREKRIVQSGANAVNHAQVMGQQLARRALGNTVAAGGQRR